MKCPLNVSIRVSDQAEVKRYVAALQSGEPLALNAYGWRGQAIVVEVNVQEEGPTIVRLRRDGPQERVEQETLTS